jgi:hypothetical protein
LSNWIHVYAKKILGIIKKNDTASSRRTDANVCFMGWTFGGTKDWDLNPSLGVKGFGCFRVLYLISKEQ